jgi:hypothetical protein
MKHEHTSRLSTAARQRQSKKKWKERRKKVARLLIIQIICVQGSVEDVNDVIEAHPLNTMCARKAQVSEC